MIDGRTANRHTAKRPHRRDVLRGLATGAAALALPCPSFAASAARVVVIGGGFGGASCARALLRADPTLRVTLVEQNPIFVACPFSNEVIAGLRELRAQQFGYDRIAAAGVGIAAQAATQVETKSRTVVLADGTRLDYDRLVLAPGIDLRYDALQGYNEAASLRMPHAWKAGEQTLLLRRQLEAMDDGGLVVIAVPPAPSRCPPAPYERASLIAHYLKATKPRSKVMILDDKDAFPQQRLFEGAWKELYPGLIERVPLSDGGRVTSVDPATNGLTTEFGNYTAQVANVIPPQKAGRIADLAGAADKTGWCPIVPATFESTLVPNVHVIGDACFAGGIPKSASSANAEGTACAEVVASLLGGRTPTPQRLVGACYNTVAPGYGFAMTGVYQPTADGFSEIDGAGAVSAIDAGREVRAREADDARSWFKAVTADAFG